MKIIKTLVTSRDLFDAQRDNYDAPEWGDSSPVWVECPDDYIAALITAECILYDDSITVVDG